MRTLQKPVKILAAALCTCLLTTFLLSSCISSPSEPPSPSADPSPLTAEQVAEMRGEYPICSGGSTQVATLPRKLEYYLGDEYESIYAQVIGKETTQRLEIQDDTVEGASAELYGATVCDYFMIPIRILDDPGGKYHKVLSRAGFCASTNQARAYAGKPNHTPANPSAAPLGRIGPPGRLLHNQYDSFGVRPILRHCLNWCQREYRQTNTRL